MRTTIPPRARPIGRRTVLKAGLALAAYEIGSPFPIRALSTNR